MKKTFLVIPAALLLAGCETVSWLQPLYTPDDIVQEEAFAGSWRGGDEDALTIEAEGDGYVVTVTGKQGGKTVYSAYLLRIDGELYADLTERGTGIPDHMPVRIEMSGDGMSWHTLHGGWLSRRVKDGTLPSERLAEGKRDTRWVVNVAPAEAQRLLRSYRYEAWGEGVAMERVR